MKVNNKIKNVIKKSKFVIEKRWNLRWYYISWRWLSQIVGNWKWKVTYSDIRNSENIRKIYWERNVVYYNIHDIFNYLKENNSKTYKKIEELKNVLKRFWK